MIDYGDFSLKVHHLAAERQTIVNAQVEVTYGCNLHCVHCYTDCYNRPDLLKREMRFEEVTRILDELQAQGCLWVCFTGGEIFARKDFLDIYAHAKRHGFLITLFTNATLITERIADFLKDEPPFSIDISCHGATEETFDAVTQVKGSFQRFLQGVRLLVKRGLPVRFKTKAMTLNHHELGQIQSLVESFGAEFRLTSAIYPRLDGDLAPAHYRLRPVEIVAIERVMEDAQEEDRCRAGGDTGFNPPPDERLFRCGCGTTGVHIGAWGTLGTCTWVNEPRADLRRMSVTEGIARVFPQVRGARYETETPCRTCEVFTLCEKMPANAGAETGDPEQPVEHFCRVAYQRAEALGHEGPCPVGGTSVR
jgi:radical SAM protein with 4Fe4S-binding SPASM domain